MAKKQTYEEQVIKEAADIIMQTIHIAANRIAEKYEQQLMDEVVNRIQAQAEVQDAALSYKMDSIPPSFSLTSVAR